MSTANLLLRLALVCFTATSLLAADNELLPRREQGSVRISAPSLRFITRRAQDLLRNGVSVRYRIAIGALNEGASRLNARSDERVSVSYDLWEERYVATYSARNLRTSSKNVADIERWILERANVPSLDAQGTYRLRLIIQRENADAPQEDRELSLLTLVNIFGRRNAQEETTWQAESRAFKPASLQ